MIVVIHLLVHFVRLQNVLKEETDSYSSAKALLEAPVVGMYVS